MTFPNISPVMQIQIVNLIQSSSKLAYKSMKLTYVEAVAQLVEKYYAATFAPFLLIPSMSWSERTEDNGYCNQLLMISTQRTEPAPSILGYTNVIVLNGLTNPQFQVHRWENQKVFLENQQQEQCQSDIFHKCSKSNHYALDCDLVVAY